MFSTLVEAEQLSQELGRALDAAPTWPVATARPVGATAVQSTSAEWRVKKRCVRARGS